MATKYYIRAGFVETSSTTKGPNAPLTQQNGKFDLHLWLKRELSSLHIAATDDCCTQDDLNLPVRLNKTANKLQYLDSGVWTNVVAAQIS